jgi:FkbM family methyltransferase
VRGSHRVRRVLNAAPENLRRRRERRRRHRHALAFYGGFVSRDDLCFDVGANWGNRTSLFLELGARVVAVEPQRECVQALRALDRTGGRLVVVEAALGAAIGEAELLTTDVDTLSTLSTEWIEHVREAGRFRLDWTGSRTVRVTTLDLLISEHGVPRFCKIDVEGYEEQVLEGLSQPLPALSFEFTPEHGEAAVACIERLRALGHDRYAFSLGESLELGPWRSADELVAELAALPRDRITFGDVYAVSGTR